MAGPRYIADPPALVRRVELDGHTALFHAPSGISHILAPPAPQILEALAGEAADADALLARIGARFEVEGGAEALRARLAELEAAGLVSRA
jgi:PqqD family protein of HPr-rel-A system